MTAAAIAGSFADAKIVKTRSTLQLIIELPIEQADAALKALGGVPQPGREKPVAVALLDTDAITSGPLAATPAAPTPPPDEVHQAPAKQRKPGAASSQDGVVRQAGILCNDRQFQLWLARKRHPVIDSFELGPEGAAKNLRIMCRVDSRREFAQPGPARDRFLKLADEFYRHIGRRPPLAGEAA